MERIDNFGSERIEATGHDMLSLLYGFLDEWLFVFNADPYFVARVSIFILILKNLSDFSFLVFMANFLVSLENKYYFI